MVYRCTTCHRVSTVFTKTVLQGTKGRPTKLILILRGIAQEFSTVQLARELDGSRPELQEFRHRLQELGFEYRDRAALPDAAVVANEMYQNARGKRGTASRRGRPTEAASQ